MSHWHWEQLGTKENVCLSWRAFIARNARESDREEASARELQTLMNDCRNLGTAASAGCLRLRFLLLLAALQISLPFGHRCNWQQKTLELFFRSAEAMGSIDAEAEIDMEISDDEQEHSKENAVAQARTVPKVEYSSAEKLLIDSDSSRKRKQSSFVETSPSVRVVYQNLSRESRKRLQDLLRRWCEWQGWQSQQNVASRDEPVENGDEQYFPALQIGPTASSFSVSFWVDRPTKQARTKDADEAKNFVNSSNQDRDSEVDVPLYDRVTPSLSSQETRENGHIELQREATRCFNCGSYSHALRDCQRPRNYDAINSARSNHNSKKAFPSGPRVPVRYYQTPAGGKDDDERKPGGPARETREPSGVRDNDPPPWLHGGRELVNPPGFVGKVDEASKDAAGIDKEQKEKKTASVEEGEEGEIVDDDVEPPGTEEELYIAFSSDTDSQDKRPSTEFSGMNLSAPANFDEHTWRQQTPTYVPAQTRSSHYQRSVSMHNSRTPTYGTPSPGPYVLNPQRVWEGRNLHYRDNASPAWETATARSAPSAPIAVPVPKKDDDDWELNFESSVYRSDSSRASSAPHGLVGYYDTGRQGLTVNTAGLTSFSPPEPSQLSPTGSGYGESFRPSSGYLPSPTPPASRNGTSTPPLPSQVSQYFDSFHTSVHQSQFYQASHASHASDSNANNAWAQAQAALSSLQTNQKGDGHSESQSHQGR